MAINKAHHQAEQVCGGAPKAGDDSSHQRCVLIGIQDIIYALHHPTHTRRPHLYSY
jgi:hypothetical protein